MAAMQREPSRATLAALRAARQAHRVAWAIAVDRITELGTVACAWCGRPVAVAANAEHPPSRFEGRVVCGVCLKSRRSYERDPLPDVEAGPPDAVDVESLEARVREGWAVYLPFAPDPRPTFGQWVREWFRRRGGGDEGVTR